MSHELWLFFDGLGSIYAAAYAAALAYAIWRRSWLGPAASSAIAGLVLLLAVRINYGFLTVGRYPQAFDSLGSPYTGVSQATFAGLATVHVTLNLIGTLLLLSAIFIGRGARKGAG